MLKGISLFEPIATGRSSMVTGVADFFLYFHPPFSIPGYETDVMIQTTDSDGHEYARSVRER